MANPRPRSSRQRDIDAMKQPRDRLIRGKPSTKTPDEVRAEILQEEADKRLMNMEIEDLMKVRVRRKRK